MPDFEIHDSETGLKLAVTGDSEPTQDEADELFRKEYSDISTNLFKLPGEKYYLDVGPIKSQREIVDEYDRKIGGHQSAKEFADKNHSAEPGKTWSSLYNQQIDRFNKTNIAGSIPPTVDAIMKNVKPGTLLINAHGSGSKKGLSTEWGHEFTMNNISKLIGDVGGISNVVNLACYGGSCAPKDYESAFPNLSTIRHSNTNYQNTISNKGLSEGHFFNSGNQDAQDTKWVKMGSEWIEIPKADARFRAASEK